MQGINTAAILIAGASTTTRPLKQWRKAWLPLTAIAAALASSVDIYLLQRKHSLFTDGFLSEYTLSGAADRASFVLMSWISDVATLGPAIGLLLVLFNAFRQKRGTQCLILALALSPILLSHFVGYQLAAYLGDAFDLGLMFDLVGKNPLELFAVGFRHALPLLLVLFAGMGFFGWALWTFSRPALNRRGIEGLSRVGRNIFIDMTLVFLVGLVLVSFVRMQSETFEHGLKRKPSGRLLESVAETLSDIDRDGYGLLGRPADPAPFNANIFPYALDLPGNGIDENGVAGDLPLEAVGIDDLPTAAEPWQRRPNLVFIMLESFRQDLIGARYKGAVVTPVLNALAQQGVSAQQVYSHNGYTVQSRYHAFTGNLVAPGDGTSLIDDFKKNGYEVAFFSGQDETFGEEKMPIGIDRVDYFYDARSDRGRRSTAFSTPGSLGLPYTVLLEKIEAFLEGRTSDRPLLLYLNLYDSHFPYRHDEISPLINTVVLKQSEIHSDRQAELQAMYMNTAANLDRAIGRVLDRVSQTLPEVPAVLVLSDHGESLFEDGFLGHGYKINEAQTRIPFIVRGLPMHIEEPFAQVTLRSALNAALSRGPQDANLPWVDNNPQKKVFQYIGTLSRPRQIALTGLGDRRVYDFRSGLVGLDGKKWRRPEALDPSEYTQFEQLVHLWENLLLAEGTKARPASF